MIVSGVSSSYFSNKIYHSKKTQKVNNQKSTKIEELPFSYQYINFKSNANLTPLNKKEKEKIFNTISEYDKNNDAVMCGSLGRVYKVDLFNRPSLAVKEFTAVYDGRNPTLEANTLKKIPQDCTRVQKFVDLIEKDGKQYLITTFQKGKSLANLKDTMSAKLISNILDELFKIEKAGISFYDYSMGNIVYDGDEPRFYDFEVAKEQSLIMPNEDAFSDLCHISRNIDFPMITNLAGFEIRTVGKIIGELEKYPDGEERSTKFVEKYLQQASKFYGNTAKLFEEKSKEDNSEIPNSAIEYSKILSELFKNPSDEIILIEKQSMRIKELLTEYWFRNDPNLEHDDALYSDGIRYVKNLKERFFNVQASIANLMNSTKDFKVKKYCEKTAKLLKMIEKKEVSYLTKKLCS
jgi:hypothetical protein